MSSLTHKAALVTGASRGLGAAIAQRLAADGAAVAITYTRSPEKAAAVVSAIESHGGRALAIEADAADAEAVQAAVSQTADAFGRLDILVNNAGISAIGAFADYPVPTLDRALAVNVRSAFIASQAAVRHMTDGGRIINIGSINSEYIPFPGAAAYVMTKAALAGLTHALARELGPRGITVNNLQPGPVDTDMNPADGPNAEMLRGFIAVKRFGTPAEVAALVAFLAGDEAGYITGAQIRIDGGFAA